MQRPLHGQHFGLTAPSHLFEALAWKGYNSAMERAGDQLDLTVVVVAWGDYVQWLPRCLEAIGRASARTREVIVVDNASEPSFSPQETFGMEVSPVRTIRRATRTTLGAARNAVLPEVTTKYVAFADVDDVLLAGSLDRSMHRLDTDRRLVLSAQRNLRDDERGQATGCWPRWQWTVFWRLPAVFALACLRKNNLPTNNSAVCRTEAVRAVGGFGEQRLHEDWVLAALLTWYGRVRCDALPGVVYRLASDTKSREHYDGRDADRRAAHLELYNRLVDATFVPRPVRWWSRRLARRLPASPR